MHNCMNLRAAELSDIDFILSQEAREEFGDLIISWSCDRHLENLKKTDITYLMIEDVDTTVKYAILSGLKSPHPSIELTRIVMAQLGQGKGKNALKLILAKVFEEYSAHRLWLDVFEHNHRARHVYWSVGFQEEGMLREAHKRGETYDSLIIMAILEAEVVATT